MAAEKAELRSAAEVTVRWITMVIFRHGLDIGDATWATQTLTKQAKSWYAGTRKGLLPVGKHELGPFADTIRRA